MGESALPVVKAFIHHGDPENCDPLGYRFLCPGCNWTHMVYTRERNQLDAQWAFNGDLIRPTFKPSIGVFMKDPARRCHSFVTDGQIQFLNDSYHALSGQTVPLPPIEDCPR